MQLTTDNKEEYMQSDIKKKKAQTSLYHLQK